MGGGACSAPVLEVASRLLACGRSGSAFDGGSSVHEVVEGATAVFVEGGLEEEGALSGGIDGGATVGVAAGEVQDDFLECVVKTLLYFGGVGGELQLNDDVVVDLDAEHVREEGVGIELSYSERNRRLDIGKRDTRYGTKGKEILEREQ